MIATLIKFAVLGFFNVIPIAAIVAFGSRWLIVASIIYNAWGLAGLITADVVQAIRERDADTAN